MGFFGTLAKIGGGIVGGIVGGPAGIAAGVGIGSKIGGAFSSGGGAGGGPAIAPSMLTVQRGGGQSCPPGTRCTGPSTGVGTFGICFGSCAPIPTRERTISTPLGGFEDRTFGPPTGNGGGGGGGIVQGGGAVCGVGGSPGNPCCAGQHPNKSSYHLKSGEFVEARSKCVTRRRLNPANGQAAIKAIRRVEATHKLLKRIDSRMAKVARRSSSTRRRR